LDSLQGTQLAAQEASGIMAAAIIQQQGAMHVLAAWEFEAGDLMREMGRMIQEEEQEL